MSLQRPHSMTQKNEVFFPVDANSERNLLFSHSLDPKQTLVILADLHAEWYTWVSGNTDKAKPAERRGRKAPGPRFLREATECLSKELG